MTHPRPLRAPIFFATALLAAVAMCNASARARAVPPDQLTRVLRVFDFEERRLGNVEELPMNWVKVEGPGLPHYVAARLATDRRRSGEHSFRFTIDGGSLLYRYPHGLIPVQPQAHYRVQVWCQTTVMPNARARLTAYCADVDGHPIATTVRMSELYSAHDDNDPWKLIGVDVTADSPDAAWLVVELGLLQPALYRSSSLGSHALFDQDIHGSAWFDDLSVAEVPTVTLHTERPGNIFRRSDSLRLVADISDRFTDDLGAQLLVRDANGRDVYQYSGALDLATAQTISSRRKRMVLALPADMPAGWYEAQLQMSSGGQSLGGQIVDLIVLADDGSWANPDPRFGLSAVQFAPPAWSQLPDVLGLTGAGRVKITVWNPGWDAAHTAPVEFDNLLERLREANIAPDAVLLALPPEIAQTAGGSNFENLLRAKRENWQPQLAFLVARHAGYFEDWQLGNDGTAAIVQNARLRSAYEKIRTEFAALVEQPQPSVAWPAWYELDSHPPAALAYYINTDVTPDQIPLYVADMQQQTPGIKSAAVANDSAIADASADADSAAAAKRDGYSVYLTPLDRQRYGREAQVSDFALRIAYALAAGVQRIDLPLPYSTVTPTTSVTQGADASESTLAFSRPQELFIIERTVTTILSRAVYKGQVPIADGVNAFLFERRGQGILMLWTSGRGTASGDNATRELALQLGDNPTRVDLWGNAAPLLASTDERNAGMTTVSLGPTPIFLLNVDPRVAELRASLALDDPRFESTFEPHTRHVRFTNTFDQTLSGDLRLRPPAGWVVNPPFFTFTLGPGQTFDHEVTVEFPFSATGGRKTIDGTFRLDLVHELKFSVPLKIDLGLSNVGVQTVLRRDGDDIIVQQLITNYGQRPLDYTSFAICPGRARQERLVVGIDPGATVIKKYRFPNVEPQPNLSIRTGLRENSGTRILNEETAVP